MTLSEHFLKNTIKPAFICLLSVVSCTSQKERPPINLIPKPASIELTGGYLKADSMLLFGDQPSKLIRYVIDSTLNNGDKEGYALQVNDKGIEIKAATSTGLFYGTQTLRQLYSSKGIPCLSIKDSPRFAYRGLHLDVSRHFFPKEEIMKLLEVMAYYKLNTLHLHLTDAGGWRIQTTSYPKLTTDAAFRTESDWQKWWEEKDRKYLPEGTTGSYGGYYTKNDIRELVTYATERHITLLPEIEFPGHSEEVFAAYPELCCTGKPHTSGDFCIGNEQSFTFMENVLSEIIELFPSEYIHIGGDEAGKTHWKNCPKCQALMHREGMQQIDELQSYMIGRAEKFLRSKGRKLIGWDEILEGGLAPEATVMSWRGEEGGIKSARMHHDVIMTPGGYLYFDFYQADPKTQPYAIGGYTPIKRVYSYNPIPEDSLTATERQHILGVQANTWTEYIKDDKHLEYMMFPRALAVAEIGWTPQEARHWEEFKPRMNANIPILQQMGIHTFTLSNEIETVMEVDTLKQEIRVTLDAEKYPVEIHYTTDGSTPSASSPRYNGPIAVKDSAHIKAAIFRDNVLQGTPTEKKVDYHRGIHKSIRYQNKLYGGYMAGGMHALLDGYRGGPTYLDGRWQGYLDNLDCVIDMHEITSVHKVSARFMQLIGPGVFQPGEVELQTSKDDIHYTSRGVIPTTISPTDKELSFQEYTFRGCWEARYIRLIAKRGNPGFIFTDEVVIW